MEFFYKFLFRLLQTKVSNKWWILNECCQRIPEDFSAAMYLLKYGLQLTDFDVFVDYHDVAGKNKYFTRNYGIARSKFELFQNRKRLMFL